jgi:pectate lyase
MLSNKKIKLGLMTLSMFSINGFYYQVSADAVSSNIEILARETANNTEGFASGTSGGSNADSQHTYYVSNRIQLLNSLGKENNQVPKIIYLSGNIDMNTNSDGKSLSATDYSAGTGYNFNEYLSDYNPKTYGKKEPKGSQESDRNKSQKNQAKQIEYKVPSNTTIIGIGDSTVTGGNMIISGNNVIVRNINFENAYDYFPQWDPKDGSTGNWNSQYDNITITGGSHVWLDHNVFSDGNDTDKSNGYFYGREYQHHDGLVDIVNGADNVTLSYNILKNHDKSMNIGNSDKKISDLGKLHVTLHNNHFDNLIQRQPRVRFGEVNIYNNYYSQTDSSVYKFMYAFGVGKQSQIYAENNDFDVNTAAEKNIAKVFGGKNFSDNGNILNGKTITSIGSINHLSQANWIPKKVDGIQSPEEAKQDVIDNAGNILK